MQAETSTLAQPVTASAPPKPERLISLDVFRGLVILVMTYVNYLSPVKDIPGWAKHMPEIKEGYTFVDVVFPAFLFIVGVAIPFALQRRLSRNESYLSMIGQILWRSAALIFVGVLTVNKGMYSEELSGLSKSLWFFLAMTSVLVLWSRSPETASMLRHRVHRALQVVAVVTLVWLLVIFRSKNGAGQTLWLQHAWWGILGLIGWAYLVCSICWLLFRGNQVSMMCLMGFMLAVYVGGRHGALDWMGPVLKWVNVGILFGSDAATVMMGIIVGNRLREKTGSNDAMARLKFILLYGIGLYVAGELVRPLHGVNKSAHTESYALVTGGISCVLFGIVYYLVDMKAWRRWGSFLVPIGQNAVLAYILPGVVGNALIVAGSGAYWSDHGVTGAWSAAALTLLIMMITWILSRWKITVRL